MGVEEYDIGWERVIEVDDVGEIGHGFVAFIRWGSEDVRVFGGTSRWVDDIDCWIPTVKITRFLSEQFSPSKTRAAKTIAQGF